MNPKQFHEKLTRLVDEACKAELPVLVITGIIECVKVDAIFKAIRTAEAEQFAAQMAALSGKDKEPKENN